MSDTKETKSETKKSKSKINWKKVRNVAIMIAAASGVFFGGVQVGKRK